MHVTPLALDDDDAPPWFLTLRVLNIPAPQRDKPVQDYNLLRRDYALYSAARRAAAQVEDAAARAAILSGLELVPAALQARVDALHERCDDAEHAAAHAAARQAAPASSAESSRLHGERNRGQANVE